APESFAAGGPATTDGPIHYQLLDEYGNLSDTGTGEGLPPVAAREAFREAAPATAPESPRREVDTRPLTLYKKGMALLQEKRHREAVAMFEDFLAQYPTHDYADNCLYWIGEAHYDRQMYHKALAAFEQVVAQHPRGNKVPDAMLKAAFCYHSLGMKDRAMELFEQLIRTWPGTPAARLAEERKTELL
ncbi:MAG: tol-pal system protein YbgF, partial [Deltaproteobacteria bacterium]|nr:tol-pal system protein YbgF [Deltaproteobacteria bacterium]